MCINPQPLYEVQDSKFTDLGEAVAAAKAAGSVVFEVRPDGGRTLVWAPKPVP